MGVYLHTDNWFPWENTVAYFPFENDQLDHSWNWVILDWSWTKDTIWYYFTSEAWISISDCNWLCAWVKLNSASWSSWAVGSFYDSKSMWRYLYDAWSSPCIRTFYTSSYAKASTPISNPNQWNFIWVWYDWTNTVYCLNDTYWILRAWSWYNFWSIFKILGKHNTITCNISYSNFIVETKPRTSNNALWYYNSIKSKYWISWWNASSAAVK